jgi:hypothetical protein
LPQSSNSTYHLDKTGSVVGTDFGLLFFKDTVDLHTNYTSQSSGMVDYMTTTYNSGWMVGDVKLALSDSLTDRSVSATAVTGTATFAAIATGADMQAITATSAITATVTTGGAIYGWEQVSGVWYFRRGTGWVGISEAAGTLTIANGTVFALLVYTITTPSTDQYDFIEQAGSAWKNAGVVFTLPGTSDAIVDLAYDKVTGEHHLLTSWGHSVWDMGRMVSSTAGSWTKVAANNGIVVLS